MTIQKAIDAIIGAVPGAPFADTVDTIKIGDQAQEVRAIAVTFMATSEVIEKAAALGVNFIITHEPTFYNHLDATGWLESNPTYRAKRQLIEDNGLTIWRFHDYLHSLKPDSTVVGLIEELDWVNFSVPGKPFLCAIPSMSLQALAEWIKVRLDLKVVRVVGDTAMQCRTVAIVPGFPPSDMQIGILANPDVDALIAGEIHEWETSEYVRDASRLGYRKGLITIGHLASEEPGMRRIIPWLQRHLPGIAIYLVRGSSAFLQV